MELREVQNGITGSMTIDHPEGPGDPRLHLVVTVTFIHDPFIKIDYRNRSDTVLQFGSCVFQLNAEGTGLVGRLVGYGSITNQIVSGEMEFARQA
jgi:hypothetical protein